MLSYDYETLKRSTQNFTRMITLDLPSWVFLQNPKYHTILYIILTIITALREEVNIIT